MDIVTLSPAQQELVWKIWSEDQIPPSISSLIKIAFPDLKNLDPRTKEGVAIKKFLIEKGASPPTSAYTKKASLELSKEQKEYIDNNYITMKSVEMARELFNNKNLSPVSQEARTIFAYVKELKGNFDTDNKSESVIQAAVIDDAIPEKDYSPPTTIDRVCSKINKYVKGEELDFRNLKVTQRRQIQSLLTYLHNHRFVYQINSYGFQTDRDLFESAFVAYTWDKDDLSAEDIDQYIILCNEKIMSSSIQRNINQLEREQKRMIDEEGKMSMTHVEALKSSRSEYSDCIKRQQNLYRALTQERSDRLANKKRETPSLLNLIALWKEEESRLEIIRLADERQEKLGEEIDRLSNMDDLKCKLVGMSKEEMLYG